MSCSGVLHPVEAPIAKSPHAQKHFFGRQDLLAEADDARGGLARLLPEELVAPGADAFGQPAGQVSDNGGDFFYADLR